jgi:hypothetical protein
MLNSKFKALLDNSQFDDAALLLKRCLAEAEFVDPRDDYSWGPASDVLGYRILAEQGAPAFEAYWEDFLKFYRNDLEPKWGHLHKGHIFFRLGMAKFQEDVTLAKKYLEESLAEDRLLAELLAAKLHLKNVETMVHRFPSYVLLCILDQIDPDYFASDEAQQIFYRGFVPLRFDVIWDQKEVEPSLVRHAIEVVVPEPGQKQVFNIQKELNVVFAQRLSAATIGLTRTLLEMILFNALYHRLEVGTMADKDIRQAELDLLLQEAIKQNLFSSLAVQSTCQLIHLLSHELYRPREKSYRYKLNPAVVGYIAYGLKIMFEAALVEWANQISD